MRTWPTWHLSVIRGPTSGGALGRPQEHKMSKLQTKPRMSELSTSLLESHLVKIFDLLLFFQPITVYYFR